MIPCASLAIPKGMKNAISVAFHLYCLIGNENITSKKCKTKKLFEIILHVGRVTSLQSYVAKKSWSNPCK